MSRSEFPAKVKAAAKARANGHCEACTAPLRPGKYHYDHDNPDGLTGQPTLDNCRVLCLPCHNVKTTTIDIPQIAKAKRREAAHIGAKRKPSRPMPGSKASPWKMKMNGTVERRT